MHLAKMGGAEVTSVTARPNVMGAQLSSIPPSAPTVQISAYVDFIEDVQYSKPIGSSRFLKTIKGLDPNGSAVLKLLIKPNGGLNLDYWLKLLEKERILLKDCSNVLAYDRIIDTERAGYLVRPFVKCNLVDRISIRPFLTDQEKKWVAFQLIKSVAMCHRLGVMHGDIKTENVLLTSWDWAVLCDFAPFKPIFLPEDNPSQFAFYFDTSKRHTCYVSPERFLQPEDPHYSKSACVEESHKLTEQMDTFSLGCVIAELFLEGNPLFTLPQLFKYKRGEYYPNLEGLDKDIKKMISKMISLSPSDRMTPQYYLDTFQDDIFPESFYSFLHPYIESLSLEKDRAMVKEECDSRIDRIYHSRPQSNHLIVLSLVLHSVRSTTHPSYRVKACHLILSLGKEVSDDIKLDRCIPYLLYLVEDPSVLVQAASLLSISQLLESVTTLSKVNSPIFPEYILPRLSHFLSHHRDPYSMAFFASVLPSLAQTARRFEAIGQLMGSASGYADFETLTLAVLTDPDPNVRMCLLRNISPLCTFFGKERTNDLILSHMITYLNDKSNHLRCAFVNAIPEMALCIGSVALQQYIVPLLIQTLSDPEEQIVGHVMRSFTQLVKLEMVEKPHLWDLIKTVIPFVLHPNQWIRNSTLGLVIQVGQLLSLADLYCFLYPLIRPFFQFDVTDFSWDSLSPALCKPLSWSAYKVALVWASRKEKSVFWQAKSKTELRLNAQDKKWVEKLKSAGLAEKDLWKILSLKDFIHSVSQSNARTLNHTANFEIQKIGVLPRNVFLEVSFQEVSPGHNPSPSIQDPAFDFVPTPLPSSVAPTPIPMPKSVPSIQATQDPVFGQLQASDSHYAEVVDETQSVGAVVPKVSHSYNGRNKYIARYLETLKYEPTLNDYSEFGKQVSPTFDSVEFRNINQAHTQISCSITCVCASPTGEYFITGDENGTVRFWDGSTFSIPFQSRYSIQLNSPVKCMCFLPLRECLVVATRKGEIKVYCVSLKGKKVSLVRDLKLPSREFVISLRPADNSDVYAITSECRLVAIDLRDMILKVSLQNPISHGIVTCFVVDRSLSWALLGTHLGFLDLWDLRFEVVLKRWQTHFPIKQMELAFGNCAAIAMQNDTWMLWDVSKGGCESVFRCSDDESNPQDGLKLVTQDSKPDIKEQASSQVSCLHLVGDYMMTADSRKRITLWNLKDPLQSKSNHQFIKRRTDAGVPFFCLQHADDPSDLLGHHDVIKGVATLMGRTFISVDRAGVLNLSE